MSVLGLQKKSNTIDTSMLEAQGYSIPRGGMPSPVKVDASQGPRVVLEIRDDDAQPHLESIPLPTDRSVSVQQLVQQGQLHEQLGELQISIMRPNGPGAPPVRLDSKTDDDGKVANLGVDYALLPGDHIIIYRDNRSMLERFVDQQFRSDG